MPGKLLEYQRTAFFAFVFVGAAFSIWPQLIAPFTFYEFWTIKGSLWRSTLGAWPLYLWGFCLQILGILLNKDFFRAMKPKRVLIRGTFASISAGIFEEIAFRWLIFFAAIVIIPALDWLLLGFWGVHPVRWFYTDFLCPIANYFTLGYLAPYLLGAHWAVAAGIISANGTFRDGHAYLGFFGYVNSWFIGMYFFFLVFTYGIISAIIVHMVYDLIIFWTMAAGSALLIYGRRLPPR